MTLEDPGNIGELTGAIAVLVTLIYLAIQLRQNARALHAQNHPNVYRDFRDNLSSFDSDVRHRYGVRNGEDGKLTASDAAKLRLSNLVSMGAN